MAEESIIHIMFDRIPDQIEKLQNTLQQTIFMTVQTLGKSVTKEFSLEFTHVIRDIISLRLADISKTEFEIGMKE